MRSFGARHATGVRDAGSDEAEGEGLAERWGRAFARDFGTRKIAAARRIQDFQADQLAPQTKSVLPDQTPQPELARIRPAVDLAVEEDVAGLDAQAVGACPGAFAQVLRRRRGGAGGGAGRLLVRGDEELVAELAAVADAPGDDVLESPKRKYLSERTASLPMRRDRMLPLAGPWSARMANFAGAVAAAVGAALAGEEPEALGVEAPDGGVDEDCAVALEEQRVGDLAGDQRVEVAGLQGRSSSLLSNS